MASSIRVRFAPSPTGFMHLGNVRAALMNYLFAKQNNGTFLLRIEDTDEQRNFDEAKKKIVEDLSWLQLTYHEGPDVGGHHGPYQQSERTHLYQEKLAELISNNRAYRCFCSNEKLEQMRSEQIKAGKPPRYDRTCINLPSNKIQNKIEAQIPFIWRFKINEHQILSMPTLQGNNVVFDMQHFADFALTRSDGSFTFIFVNFVDDWLMKITHVIRGEDHLSNTALQCALYDAFALTTPIFWHLPIICNEHGEKLSKRDFGFSLNDLRENGFLPEAILNYLALMGTSSTQEIQSKEELSESLCFEKLTTHGGIRYDLPKLQWFNQQWLNRIPEATYIKLAKNWIAKTHSLNTITPQSFEKLLMILRKEIKTLHNLTELTQFYFTHPTLDITILNNILSADKKNALKEILIESMPLYEKPTAFVDAIKKAALENQISTKELLQSVRYVLTGFTHGIGIVDLLEILPKNIFLDRINFLNT